MCIRDRLISIHKGTKEQFLNNKFITNKTLCPFIAIPTTAGTGSEETNFAVVYSNKLKYSIIKEGFVCYKFIVEKLLFSSFVDTN